MQLAYFCIKLRTLTTTKELHLWDRQHVNLPLTDNAPPRLMDQIHEACRCRYFSPRRSLSILDSTAHLLFYIQHPRELHEGEVTKFLYPCSHDPDNGLKSLLRKQLD